MTKYFLITINGESPSTYGEFLLVEMHNKNQWFLFNEFPYRGSIGQIRKLCNSIILEQDENGFFATQVDPLHEEEQEKFLVNIREDFFLSFEENKKFFQNKKITHIYDKKSKCFLPYCGVPTKGIFVVTKK